MSVVHVVLFQWSSAATIEAKEDIRTFARGMQDRIPGIDRIVEGPSVSPEGREHGHDWALIVTFRDVASRDAYLPHPVHVEFGGMLDGMIADVTVYDVLDSSF